MKSIPLSLKKAMAVIAACGALGAVTLVAQPAMAYSPGYKPFYTASEEDKANFNKKNPILYPKAAQLEDGTLIATFERSVGDPVGQTMPIYRSVDYGTTWEAFSEVPSPAALTAGTERADRYAKYTSNWTNPYLYVMPETVGNLTKGTLLLASIVSGDDPYLKEQLAKNPDFNRVADDFDRKDVALALYASDDGKDWNFLDIVAEGGWQGSYGGPFATENTYHQNDPVWEPFLMVYEGQLVCYYSDENEYDWDTYDIPSGTIQLHPDNATDPEDGGSGQILMHKTWDGVGAWSDPVVDEAGFELKGKYAGGGRAGMTTVAKTTDGKWMMTFEWWNGGDANIQYKIADDPLKFSEAVKHPITDLVGGLTQGGSPVLINLPDGGIVYEANGGDGDVWINESGASDGVWKRYKTAVPAGYSRNMTYVPQTGRLVLLQGTFGGFDISHGEVDLGESVGAYYQLVNRKTGQVLGTDGNTQDAVFNPNGDKPDVLAVASDAETKTQYWHVMPASGDGAVGDGVEVKLLNRSGGRALGLYNGNAGAGGQLTQWVDDNGSDKLWIMETTEDGYYRLKSGKAAGEGRTLYANGGTEGGNVTLTAQAYDGSDEWMLVRDVAQIESATVEGLSDVTVEAGVTPVLPQSVTVTLGNASVEYDDASVAQNTPVTWEMIDPSQYAQAGEFTVSGTAHVVSTGVDTEIPVSVTVTVTDNGGEVPNPDPDPEPEPGPGDRGQSSDAGTTNADGGENGTLGNTGVAVTAGAVLTLMLTGGATLIAVRRSRRE